jgi:hypothetical protein
MMRVWKLPGNLLVLLERVLPKALYILFCTYLNNTPIELESSCNKIPSDLVDMDIAASVLVVVVPVRVIIIEKMISYLELVVREPD